MNFQNIIKKYRERFESFFNSATFYVVLGVFLLLLVTLKSFFIYIQPNELGIKQVKFGFNKGIQDEVYSTGIHFMIPGIELFHIFPKDLQVFDLSSVRNNASSKYSDKSAYIQTSDGFFVDVDASIIFRIVDPYKVIKTIGPGDLFYINGLQPKAEPALKETLGKLTTEQFYDPYLRVQKMNEARDKLSSELYEKGIAVEHVLIRYFKYSNEIQKNIEEKKLKDQLIYKEDAEANAAEQAALVQKMIEEGEAIIKVEIEKGKAYQVTKKSEQELYVRTKEALGNLKVKEAEAEKARLKNNALRGVGSENLVGLEMAKVLDGIEIIVLPSDGEYGLNPLNLEKTRTMFD